MSTEELRDARRRADIKQSEIAAELGISTRSVQSFEYGQRPLPKARTLADWFAAIEAVKARRARKDS